MLSPFRLSVVCNVRAPYLTGWNFLQFFFAFWYLSHPLTYTENFTEIVPGEPLRRGFKRKWGHWDRTIIIIIIIIINSRIVLPQWVGQPNIAIFDLSEAVYQKRCKIGGKSVLITNRKSYMSFRLVPKSVTLNYLERQNGPFCVISPNSAASGAHCIKVVEDKRKHSATEM